MGLFGRRRGARMILRHRRCGMVDLNAGKAACIEGRGSPSREDEGGLGMARLYGEKHTNHWYVVKNEYFEVDEEAHTALPSGMQFRLYHTPKSKLLLSIEPKLVPGPTT